MKKLLTKKIGTVTVLTALKAFGIVLISAVINYPLNFML